MTSTEGPALLQLHDVGDTLTGTQVGNTNLLKRRLEHWHAFLVIQESHHLLPRRYAVIERDAYMKTVQLSSAKQMAPITTLAIVQLLFLKAPSACSAAYMVNPDHQLSAMVA